MLKFNLAILAMFGLFSAASNAVDSKSSESNSHTFVQSDHITITWVNPENFVDVFHPDIKPNRFRMQTMARLNRYMGRLAANLPKGQTLKVTITDLDLAGRILKEPWIAAGRRPNGVRVLNDLRLDAPNMVLSYELLDAGNIVSSGETELKDKYFDQRPMGGLIHRTYGLPLEKKMIKRWFYQEFQEQITAANEV